MLKEFKKFITEGNVMDLAVAVIMGAAVKEMVDGLINGLIAPGRDALHKEPAPEPTTKTCPYCKSEIDITATRCPHCTSELTE